MPNVPTTNLNALYANTAPGNVIQSAVIDPALQDLAQAINDNYALFQELKFALELPIPDQSIVTRHLRNLAVTNPKLAPLAVTADKIADGSITLAKLADLVVTAAKIANFTLTENKYGTGSVSTRAIANEAVTADKINPSLLASYGNIATNAKFEVIDAQLADIAINVKSLGVKGDGTVDTTAIQAAFTLANTNGKVKLYFPDGVYVIDYYIRLYKNTTVVMSPGAIIKRSDTTTYAKMFINGIRGRVDYATGYDGEGNIHFHGGTIDMNCFVNPLPEGVGISAFDLGHAQDLSFVGLKLKNGENSHFFQISGCKDVLIDKCQILYDRYSNTGVTPNFESIQIEPLTATSFPSFGVGDNTISQNITVSNCVFDGVVRGIGTHSYVPDPIDNTKVLVYCKGIKIINNVFRNIKDHVLDLWGYDDVYVEGNIIEGNLFGYGIKVYKSKNVKVRNNFIKNTYNSGLYAEDVDDSSFRDNTYLDTCYGGSPSSPYSAIRLSFVTDSIFDEIVRSATPKHAYPIFTSDCQRNKIVGGRMDNGSGTQNGGGLASASNNINLNSVGAYSKVLFNGTLDTLAQTAALGDSIYAFTYIIIMGNDNGSATNNLTSIFIPKDGLTIGSSVDRFKLLTDNADSVSFSFPDANTIRLDTLVGTCRIRKVIGVM